MRQTKVKQIRKYILSNTQDVLLTIRNECGRKTEKMGPRQIYQQTKRLYKAGKIKV